MFALFLITGCSDNSTKEEYKSSVNNQNENENIEENKVVETNDYKDFVQDCLEGITEDSIYIDDSLLAQYLSSSATILIDRIETKREIYTREENIEEAKKIVRKLVSKLSKKEDKQSDALSPENIKIFLTFYRYQKNELGNYDNYTTYDFGITFYTNEFNKIEEILATIK